MSAEVDSLHAGRRSRTLSASSASAWPGSAGTTGTGVWVELGATEPLGRGLQRHTASAQRSIASSRSAPKLVAVPAKASATHTRAPAGAPAPIARRSPAIAPLRTPSGPFGTGTGIHTRVSTRSGCRVSTSSEASASGDMSSRRSSRHSSASGQASPHRSVASIMNGSRPGARTAQKMSPPVQWLPHRMPRPS